MSRPTEICILGHRVRVCVLRKQFDDSVLGYCDYPNATIHIQPALPEHIWQTTLLHEMTHYISDALALGLSEEEVSGIGTALYSAGIRMR